MNSCDVIIFITPRRSDRRHCPCENRAEIYGSNCAKANSMSPSPPVQSVRRRSFFKVLGIPIRIHSSLILLLVYLIFVTALQFPIITREAGVNPLTLSFGPIPWAVILAISLLLSVLVHEMGHAWVAKSQGLEVRSITLMMLGGISSIERMPDKPSSELKLAIAGPMVSIMIFIVSSILGSVLASSLNQGSSWQGPILFFHWLSQTNLVLAIFNLLPAFPLDGGRVLRALLSMIYGPIKATQLSIRISHGFAIVMGILGFLTLNIFLLLVAFFIYAGAQSEGQMTIAKSHLKEMLAGSLIHRILPIDDHETITEAALRMRELRETILPVRSRQNLPALITLEQILRVPQESRGSTKIQEVMETLPSFVDFQQPLSTVFEAIASSPLGALPARKDNEIIGIIRYADLSIEAELSAIDQPEKKIGQKEKAA